MQSGCSELGRDIQNALGNTIIFEIVERTAGDEILKIFFLNKRFFHNF